MSLICSAILTAMAVRVALDSPIYLGVIEERPSADDPPKASQFVIRTAFRNVRGMWAGMPSGESVRSWNAPDVLDLFPKVLDWTITFDGRNLGALHSARPKLWEASADFGVYEIPVGARIPMIRDDAKDFDYWSLPKSVRPVPVVSGLAAVTDPGAWKRWRATAEVTVRLLPALQRAFQTTCGPVTLQNVRRASRVFKAYRSATSGDRLIAFLFQGERLGIPCGETRPDEANAYYWFLLRGDSIRFLDRDLMLIDAGDYDGDGVSELLFHRSGYNYDGYLLLHSDLQRQSVFGWKYH